MNHNCIIPGDIWTDGNTVILGTRSSRFHYDMSRFPNLADTVCIINSPGEHERRWFVITASAWDFRHSPKWYNAGRVVYSQWYDDDCLKDFWNCSGRIELYKCSRGTVVVFMDAETTPRIGITIGSPTFNISRGVFDLQSMSIECVSGEVCPLGAVHLDESKTKTLSQIVISDLDAFEKLWYQSAD